MVQKVVDKPITVIVLFAIIVGFGIYVISDIPLEQTPDIEMPMLIVSTSYSGAGPEEVEKTVTRTVEGALMSISGLESMTSTSSEGSCRVSLEFVWGTDISAATDDVRDALDRIKNSLPDDAGTPQIFKFNMSSQPILQLAVEGDMTIEELRVLAENKIQPLIEQIDGVAITSLSGGNDRSIVVRVAQDRLDAYGLTISTVASSLATQNVQLAGGTFQEGQMRYVVRTKGEYTSLSDIENSVVTYKKSSGSSVSKPVLLKDIATVTDDYEDSGSKVYINGKPGIYISVQKQSGTNSIAVAERSSNVSRN
jgi:HAE1 family hydrophobic/amphiphilic exporter-1